MNLNYIPDITHPSGQVLISSDWEAAGVRVVAAKLATLLIKPGLPLLSQLNRLKAYWDWPHQLILDTQGLTPNASGKIELRSPFDGRKHHFSEDDIHALIKHLKPDVLSDKVFYINNQPAKDALKGNIYNQDQAACVYAIQDSQYALDFSLLSDDCKCTACRAQLTRAYFHHLYQHTPLLCHRFLIMHNLWLTHQGSYLPASLG